MILPRDTGSFCTGFHTRSHIVEALVVRNDVVVSSRQTPATCSLLK